MAVAVVIEHFLMNLIYFFALFSLASVVQGTVHIAEHLAAFVVAEFALESVEELADLEFVVIFHLKDTFRFILHKHERKEGDAVPSSFRHTLIRLSVLLQPFTGLYSAFSRTVNGPKHGNVTVISPVSAS